MKRLVKAITSGVVTADKVTASNTIIFKSYGQYWVVTSNGFEGKHYMGLSLDAALTRNNCIFRSDKYTLSDLLEYCLKTDREVFVFDSPKEALKWYATQI